MNNERVELLARIAEMYYEQNLTQSQIAQRVGYSRSMVSRLISEARENNIVEIRIHYPLQRIGELEEYLRDALHLKDVRVLRRGPLSYTAMLRRLGGLAAQFLEEHLRDYITIGTSWGTALYETVNAMRPHSIEGVRVIQMIGALGTPNPEIDGPELARRLARLLGGRYATLPLPLIVDSEVTRLSLLNSPYIQRVTQHFRSIDLALVGVGTVDNEFSSLLRAGYLDAMQLESLRSAGAVGDVCAIHIDIQGNLIDTPLTRSIVGIDADTLQAIPLRIGVAGGQAKAIPIIAACRAGLINSLVTDEIAALHIQKYLKGESQQQCN
ncbi:MAG: sugar-binding transcriptional regulator [Anaerolineales bacterium]|nr:sugar-binding transcriptional regulator [Anaerolineales bacterium]MDW8163065.1 sugar-binding transcriptional regulator [Anaerolineales bacterium]